MLRRFAPLLLVASVLAIFAVQTLYFYPKLPDRIATHFGPSGQPDGWMAKDAFVKSFGTFLFLFTLLLSSTASLLRIVPTAQINLPRKEYWLSPSRRERTLRSLAASLLRLSAATAAFMLCVAQQIFQTNLTPDPRLGSSPWLLLTVYLVFTTYWTVSLIRRFSKPTT